ncbi:MAG TPA: phosphonate ABC transporter ATP-binding protein [Crenalkalicoccus sp.]|nr:phosphonate ABC transporter ATP-binding protein [Crenalkalicoccus sp.]
MTAPPALQVERLARSYAGRRVLNLPSLTVAPGEMVALIGSSGSGKSTLIRLLCGLVTADRGGTGTGVVRARGALVQAGGRLDRRAGQVRARIGVVFQQFNLVDRLPVITNVLIGALARIPLWRSLPRLFTEAERRQAMAALERVGIAPQAWQRASTLSGGQQQRAAIARALMQRAGIILADEPIASLDPESATRVMEILAELNRRDGITVVVSLHQVEVAFRYCRRIVALRQGEVVHDGPPEALDPGRLAWIYGTTAAPPPSRAPARAPAPAEA